MNNKLEQQTINQMISSIEEEFKNNIFDSSNTFTTSSTIDSSFTYETLQKAIDLIKELQEKYPKREDDINIFLITYDDNLIAPETMLKSRYEDKNYVMMNIYNFNKLIEESEKQKMNSYSYNFETLYSGYHNWSGIPVWYDDELIKKILNYHIDNMIKNGEYTPISRSYDRIWAGELNTWTLENFFRNRKNRHWLQKNIGRKLFHILSFLRLHGGRLNWGCALSQPLWVWQLHTSIWVELC